MKIYSLYLISRNILYAVTDNKSYIKKFLSERNRNLFKVNITKFDKDDGLKYLDSNKFLKLNEILLEDSDGVCTIIGTIQEDDILGCICEKMSENCEYLKLHFTQNVPFNNEYKSLLNELTTITKNINNHPIIQIDSVKLFYYLFKDTFVEAKYLDYLSDDDDDTNVYMEKYKIYF